MCPISLFFFQTVLKSDSSNGVFGFAESSLTVTATEGTSIPFTIDRSIASFGAVTLSWEIRHVVNNFVSGIATENFNPSSGAVNFSPGEVQRVRAFSIVLDDPVIFNTPLVGSQYCSCE